MARTVETKCDLCNADAMRYSSFFDINDRSLSQGIMQIPKPPMKVSARGCQRYDKYIDLCYSCQERILKAVQSVVDEYATVTT